MTILPRIRLKITVTAISLTLGACSANQMKTSPLTATVGPCTPSDLKDDGLVTFDGELSRTKGAQLVIQGPRTSWAILTVPKGVKKQDWQGRRVRVSGRRCVYSCGLQEQCLTPGAIPYIQHVKMDVWEHDGWKPVVDDKPPTETVRSVD